MSQESLITQPAANDNANPPPVDDGGTPPPADRPEYVPEKFWADGQVNVENLAKSYVELEKMRGASIDQLKEQWAAERLAERPETPDAYTLPEHEALDMEQMAQSPIVSVFRKVAHEAGLPEAAFQAAINEYAEAEVARMQQAAEAEMKALGENAKARTEAVSLWAQQRFGGDPAKFAAIAQVCTTAAGVEAIELLMKDAGAPPMTGDAGAPGGNQAEEEAEIRKLMNSPEYYDTKRRDPKVVARVEAFYARKYGK